MTSIARLGLAGVSLVVLLLPLALPLPGLPTHLKADEAAYYGMALSLAHDGDLRLDTGDVDRIFTEFPYRPVNNVILMTRDGWHTVYYGKPWVYSLFAAPFARLLGGTGLLFANALLLVAMMWMGAAHLRRHNGEGVAALFAAGFFLLSLAFVYTSWMQPEVFNMAALAACLFLGMPRDEEEGLPHPRRDLALAALSGAALALAVYNKPMVALVGLAPLAGMVRRRRLRAAGAWLAGAAAGMALLVGLSLLLTGTPSSYLGVQRGGFTLCGPGQMPVTPEIAAPAAAAAVPGAAATSAADPTPTTAAAATPATAGRAAAAAAASSPTGNTFSWLLRLPDTSPSEIAQNLGYFLWGRHAGLLLYTPFAAVAVVFFLLHGRRSVERWVLLASLAAVALFFLLQISWNWQGGGGFVGNRYFVNVYPGFLFLVTRIRPPALMAAGYGAAGLFLSPLLLSPFGLPVVEPTLQAHVRGRPFRPFPLELTLRNVPGYHRVPVAGVRAIGRRDVFLPRGGETFWVHGATPVEIWLVRHQATPGPSAPLPRSLWELHSLAPANTVEIRFGDLAQTIAVGAGGRARLELPSREPDREWTIFCPGDPPPEGARPRCPVSAWRLEVRTTGGRPALFTREQPPSSCPGWPHDPISEEAFFLGAELTWLGEGDGIETNVFAVEWLRVIAPPRVEAGSRFPVRVGLVNRSAGAWPERGGARVRLSYHWRDAAGELIVLEGERTELPRRVGPGETLRMQQDVVAPALPGHYLLELDPVFERVSWFGDRGARTLRVPVEVVPAGVLPPQEATADEGAAAPESGGS